MTALRPGLYKIINNVWEHYIANLMSFSCPITGTTRYVLRSSKDMPDGFVAHAPACPGCAGGGRLFRVQPNGSLMCDHCGKPCHGATFRVRDDGAQGKQPYQKPELVAAKGARTKANAAKRARELGAEAFDAMARGDIQGAALLGVASMKYSALVADIEVAKATNWRAALRHGGGARNPTARTLEAGGDPCPGCGECDHDITVYTMHPEFAYDGDPVVCSCGHTGTWHDGGGDEIGVDWACIPDLAEAHTVFGPACDHCGSAARIRTHAAQRPGYEWYANEDDDAHCVNCLAEGVVNWDPDEGEAWVCWGYAPEPPRDVRQRLGDALGQVAEAAGLGAPLRVVWGYKHGSPNAQASWSGGALVRVAGGTEDEMFVVRVEELQTDTWKATPWWDVCDLEAAGRVLRGAIDAQGGEPC